MTTRCISAPEPAWTIGKYSQEPRTITLTGLTTGTVYQVRARALGGSTGQSDWSMPGSSIVDWLRQGHRALNRPSDILSLAMEEGQVGSLTKIKGWNGKLFRPLLSC